MRRPGTTRRLLSIAILLAVVGATSCTQTQTQQADPDPVFEDAKILKVTGYRHLGTGEIDRAIASLRKSLQKDPTDPETVEYLGYAYVLAGLDAEAVQVVTDGLKERGDVPELLDLRALAYLKMRRYSEALADLERALDPELHYLAPPVTYSRLAEALWGVGRMNDAIEAYHKAIVVAPMDPMLRMALVRALEQVGRKQEALAELEKLVFLAPNDPVAHFEQGRLQLELGKQSEALRSFRRCLELDPAGPKAAEAQRFVELLEKSR